MLGTQTSPAATCPIPKRPASTKQVDPALFHQRTDAMNKLKPSAQGYPTFVLAVHFALSSIARTRLSCFLELCSSSLSEATPKFLGCMLDLMLSRHLHMVFPTPNLIQHVIVDYRIEDFFAAQSLRSYHNPASCLPHCLIRLTPSSTLPVVSHHSAPRLPEGMPHGKPRFLNEVIDEWCQRSL